MDDPVILVLSADRAKIAFLKEVLKKGFCLIECRDQKAALDYAKRTALDAILVDAHLPSFSLTDFCNAIRKIVTSYETPLLAITHNLKKSFREKAEKAGISGFIIEGLDKEEILETLHKTLENKNKHANLSQFTLALPKISLPSVVESTKSSIQKKAMEKVAALRHHQEALTMVMIQTELSSKEALLKLASSLKKQIRKTDILVPYTKDTFLLFLPSTSLKAAETIAKNLQESISSSVPLSIGAVFMEKNTPLFGNSPSKDFKRLFDTCVKAVKKAQNSSTHICTLSLEEK